MQMQRWWSKREKQNKKSIWPDESLTRGEVYPSVEVSWLSLIHQWKSPKCGLYLLWHDFLNWMHHNRQLWPQLETRTYARERPLRDHSGTVLLTPSWFASYEKLHLQDGGPKSAVGVFVKWHAILKVVGCWRITRQLNPYLFQTQTSLVVG